MMSLNIADTPFSALEAAGRLLSPVHKGPTPRSARFGFRGEIALKFQKTLENEKRPPEVKLDQVLAVSEQERGGITFLAGVAVSLEHLQLLCEVLGESLLADGKYFFFAGNLDISKRFEIRYGGALFRVLPLDEATVYNEVLELLGIERSDLKKLDTAEKLDALADAAAGFTQTLPSITFEEGLKIMGPIRIRENRPV
jgi:hypothetical protein